MTHGRMTLFLVALKLVVEAPDLGPSFRKLDETRH